MRQCHRGRPLQKCLLKARSLNHSQALVTPLMLRRLVLHKQLQCYFVSCRTVQRRLTLSFSTAAAPCSHQFDLYSKERREQPQIRIDRNLETARDGLWTGFPNELRLSASVPKGKGARFCTVGIALRFTQLNPLIDGDLTAADALAALRGGPANSITASEVSVQLDAYFNSNSVSGFESYKSSFFYRDYERGKYMLAVSDMTWKAASGQDISKVMDEVAAAVKCIVRGFVDQEERLKQTGSSEEVLASLCSGCVVTGSIDVPNETDMRVVTALGIDVSDRAASLAVVAREGQVVWQYNTAEWSELEPLPAATDDTGNVFIRYNPGRYDGVVVLRIRSGVVESFGSLPEAVPLAYAGRFYNANVVDVDNDGLLDIAVHEGFCESSCAGDVVFRWNGSDYVES